MINQFLELFLHFVIKINKGNLYSDQIIYLVTKINIKKNYKIFINST